MQDEDLREVFSVCRICPSSCGTRLLIDRDDRIVDVRGDRQNVATQGYTCFRGLQAGELLRDSDRVLQPQKRMPDGRFVPIELEQALDEIAEKISALIGDFGPDALALFHGTGGGLFSTLARPFLAAMGSRQLFTTATIDQSAKFVAMGRLGMWAGGFQEFEDMDVLLVFGGNPLISHSAYGVLMMDPVRRLRRAKANGLKMIVIDPRRSETAHFAELMLQPYPGQDSTIAAGLIRLILAEGWEDTDFTEQFVGAESMARLRSAVEPFSPEVVERRSGLAPGQLREAATLFARDGRVGVAYGSTGPNMAPYSNLAQHLIETINVICGRFPRAGEPVRRVGMLEPAEMQPGAFVIPPTRSWEDQPPSRIRGAFALQGGERLSGTLAEEILTPGRDQVRALVVDGGNPVLALPDQKQTVAAFESLELLVCIEPWMTPTAKLAHYIFPPFLFYERDDIAFSQTGFRPGATTQFAPAVVQPPPGSDLVHDWYIYWSIASRLGKQIVYPGKRALDASKPPTTDELLELQVEGSRLATRMSLDELRRHPHGVDFGTDALGVVGEAPPGMDGRFDVMPEDVAGELAECLERMSEERRTLRDGHAYDYLLIPRRLRDVSNSNGPQIPSVRKRNPTNRAYLHSDELQKLELTSGDLVTIRSSHGEARFVIDSDDNLRQGVVSVAHGWGDLPEDGADPWKNGTCVNLLIDADRHYEAINAMPHFSAVPVDIARASS